ncbi:MAG: hypothetical protein KIS66_08675 [Fimbriimonadaceae bacterium]|nr:hypothetical protein [Fimbriimonadaceae bacterium]
MWSLGLCAVVTVGVPARTLLRNPTVTLERSAVTLERAAKEVSEKTGIIVRADPAIGKEVVAFRARDARLSDVLGKIADAVGVDLESTKEGGYRLFLSEETRRAQTAAHDARLADEFRRIREELTKGARLDQDGDASYFRAWVARRAKVADLTDEERYFAEQRLDTERSEARFGLRLLQGVRPEDAARIPPGEFRLFRSQPTARQLKLSLDNPSAVLARFVRERRAHVALKPPPKPDEAVEAAVPARSSSAYRMVHLPLEEPVPEDLAEPIVFIGRRLDQRGALDLRALAATREGRIIEVWSDLAVPDQGLDGFRIPKVPEGLPGETERFRETVAAREFFERTRATESPIADSISGELAALLKRPEEVDPWSFVTEALFQIPRDGRVSIAFSPVDPTYSNIVRACAPERTFGDLFRALVLGGYRLDHRDGWLTIAPTDPVAARAAFLDRTRLGAFARAVALRGYADFRSRCLVATPIEVSRFGSPSALSEMLLGVMTREQGISNVWPVDELWRRALGELPDSQWRALDRGDVVSVLSLTGTSKRAVEALFYGGYLTMLRQAPDGAGTEGMTSESPTFAHPLALPASLALTLAVRSEEALVGVGGSSRVRFGDVRTLEGWANAQAWQERFGEPKIESVLRPGRQVRREYRLEVGGWFGPFTATEFVCDFARPGFTLDALPVGLAMRFAPLLELARGRANASRVDVGRKPPPPWTFPAGPSGPTKESPPIRIK